MACKGAAAGDAGVVDAEHPLCRRTVSRFVLFPIEHPALWRHYKQAQAHYWVAESLDFAGDIEHFHALNAGERHFVTHVLAFFAAADGIVNENVNNNFYDEITVPEARQFYALQMAVENVHMETYGLLVKTYIQDDAEQRRVLDALRTMPSVAAKAAWAIKWMDRERATLAERLVAFVAVEGISFSGSFCAIFWLKRRGVMPGLCHANELISRDEALHCKFGMALYALLGVPLEESRVHEIVREAVDAETAFITDALSCELIGMNAALMIEYIRAVANVTCIGIGVRPLFPGAQNPFEWMTLIDVPGKTNFFERRVAEYTQAHVGHGDDSSHAAHGRSGFVLDAAF